MKAMTERQKAHRYPKTRAWMMRELQEIGVKPYKTRINAFDAKERQPMKDGELQKALEQRGYSFGVVGKEEEIAR